MSKFVDQILARLKGDDTQALATKIARKTKSALSGQISALEGKLIDDEDRVETAEENLSKAIYPTVVPGDGSYYINTIVKAQAELDKAKEMKKLTEETIEYFKGILSSDTEEAAK